MTEEELREKQEIKRRKQHDAWARWYRGPKGEAYRLKRKLKEVEDDPTSPSAK